MKVALIIVLSVFLASAEEGKPSLHDFLNYTTTRLKPLFTKLPKPQVLNTVVDDVFSKAQSVMEGEYPFFRFGPTRIKGSHNETIHVSGIAQGLDLFQRLGDVVVKPKDDYVDVSLAIKFPAIYFISNIYHEAHKGNVTVLKMAGTIVDLVANYTIRCRRNRSMHITASNHTYYTIMNELCFDAAEAYVDCTIPKLGRKQFLLDVTPDAVARDLIFTNMGMGLERLTIEMSVRSVR